MLIKENDTLSSAIMQLRLAIHELGKPIKKFILKLDKKIEL